MAINRVLQLKRSAMVMFWHRVTLCLYKYLYFEPL